MTRLWNWVVANPELASFILQQVIFSGLSAICQTMEWTKASKIFGTLTTLDVGRLIRFRDKENAIPKVSP